MDVSKFEVDPYPGNPKILFIGLGSSSHTHSWIDLLAKSELNMRLFSVPGGGVPPVEFSVASYVCEPTHSIPLGLDSNNRRSFYPLPEKMLVFEKELKNRNKRLQTDALYLLFRKAQKILDGLGNVVGMPALGYKDSCYKDLPIPFGEGVLAHNPEGWLAQVIREWQPDIIHTLGLFDGQGGMFYLNARETYGLGRGGKWILQLRGGSDIELRRYNQETSVQILRAFAACDEIVTDNLVNIDYIQHLGFGNKVSSVSPVPGTGGFEIENPDSLLPPSRRQRIILWTKAYESKWSKALPVIEGIRLAWESIRPCKVIITAATPEVRDWLCTLPEDILNSCEIRERIPRSEMMSLMRNARVLLAPSLVDGVPNVLYEAMATGAFPIVSPLETITPIVSEPDNVLFARNLHPNEIAVSIVKAMSDNSMVDISASRNLKLVNNLASRSSTSKKVIDYYYSLFEFDKIGHQQPLVSVVIPFYNRIHWLKDAVYSVLRQTYQNFEIILVNDGSTESLDEIAQINDPRIQILYQDNRGPAAARNHGMRISKGEYIAFLDSDDLFEPNKLMYQLKHLLNYPDVWLAHTSYRYFNSEGNGEVVHSGMFGGFVYPYIFAGCPICMSTVMIKRTVVDNGIFLDERYRVSEDIIFFSLITKNSERILGIDIPFTLFRKTASTHAFSSQAQIIGSKNILHFLRDSDMKLASTHQKEIFFRIYSYMSDHYFLLGQPYYAYVYDWISFWYQANKISYLIEQIKVLGKKIFFKIKTFLFEIRQRA